MKTSISNNISRKHAVAVFTISVIFAVSAGFYHFHQTRLLQFPPLQYRKQGHSKTSACPKLFSKGSHAFSSFLSLSAASKITALATCALSHHFQNLYNSLSSTLIYTTSISNSMLTPTRNSRQLRSTSSNPLYIPRVKTKAGTRAFSVAVPTVWNSLPVSVK